jgi:S-adenosylhomocysteine hydrolase
MFVIIKKMFHFTQPSLTFIKEPQMASVVENLKTISANETANAQNTVQTHDSIVSAVEAEAEVLLASAGRLTGKVYKEAESVFQSLKTTLIADGKVAESDVEAAWVKVKSIL